ncbi:serine/threonine-protein kinase [Vibrio pectenicida]|nr:serine/threonine-protein kinase [Vibrio pectenicida]
MRYGMVEQLSGESNQKLVVHAKPHKLIKIDNLSGYYIKQLNTQEALEREWTALNECRGSGIQSVLYVDWGRLQLTLEFDRYAIPLSEFGPQDLALFNSLIPDIINVISHCHKNGWVHGDIKPSNMLYVPYLEDIRLIDFGASLRLGTSRELLTDWQVTPMFASSKQMNGEGLVTVDDDWYSLMKIINQVIHNG